MRGWLFLLVSSLWVCAGATRPAAADDGGAHQKAGMMATAHTHAPPRAAMRRHGNPTHPSDVFRRFGLIQPVPVFPSGVSDESTGSSRPAAIIVTPDLSGPRLATGSAAAERPSVETTPQGVVIVRGTGFRHLER